MSYKIDGTLKRRLSNDDKLSCEVCQNGQSDIYVCDLCFLFCCSTCTKGHLCPNQTLETSFKFQMIETSSHKPLQLCKKVSEGGNPRFGQFSNSKNQWNRSCQRCYITVATRSCLKCKIRHYCEHCFKSIHSSNKLSTHEFTQIRNIKDKSSYLINNEPKSRIKTVSTMQLNQYIQQMDKQATNSNESTFNTLQANLKIVKNSLFRQYANHQNEVNECIDSISKCFDNLIEQIKLKMIEIIMKIRDSSKNTIFKYDQVKKALLSQQKIISNLRYLQKQDLFIIPLDVIEAKIQACSKNISEFVIFSQLNTARDPIAKRYSDIQQQIEQLRLKVNRVQVKKNYLHIQKLDSSKISSVSNNTSRNEKSTNYLKSPLNMTNTKGNDKASSLTFSLITPKKSQHVLKTQKQIQNTVTKSLFISQNAMSCPEDEFSKSLQVTKGFTFDSKKHLQKKTTQNSKDKKYFPALLLSPKASIKKFDRCNENSAKSKIAKTGMNIQKTKKMIKDIRNEMISFSYRYNSQKQYSQFSEMEASGIDVSQLSIESLVQKSNKV